MNKFYQIGITFVINLKKRYIYRYIQKHGKRGKTKAA